MSKPPKATPLDRKIVALVVCFDNGSYEDAAGHLCDLLELCRLRITPSRGKPFRTLAAMVKHYGACPKPPEIHLDTCEP